MLNQIMMTFNHDCFTVLWDLVIVCSKVFKLKRLIFNRNHFNIRMVNRDCNRMGYSNILMMDNLLNDWLLLKVNELKFRLNDVHWG